MKNRSNGWRPTWRCRSLALGAIVFASLLGVANADEMTHKGVLMVPYHLDNFNTADSSWLKRLLAEKGFAMDVINPEANQTRQLNIIEAGISSDKYGVIIWQPIDDRTAGVTAKKIQDAGIGQVLNFSTPQDVSVSFASVDWKTVYTASGEDAAKYILAHPELGPPAIAFIGPQPNIPKCVDTFDSLVAGVRNVFPAAKVVFQEGSTSQETARSKMADFITGGVPFNIFAGCGERESLGGIAAIAAAGLGGATDKKPEHVYMMSLGGSPPELELLWNKDSAVMRVGLFGPKTAAEAVAKLTTDLLSGATKIDQLAEMKASVIFLTPDCAKERELTLEQFQGVEGFVVPACTFEYNDK